MKILILCNKSPYPPREGGPIAINMMVEGLLHAGHEVKILSMNTNKYYIKREDIPAEYVAKTGIEFIDIDLRIRWLKALINLISNHSYHIARFISRDFRSRLTGILKKEHFDIIQFEMLYTTPYLETARKYSKARMIFRAHNIEHLIWERIAETCPRKFRKIYLEHLAKTLKKYELTVVPKFNGIAAITENDAAFFRKYNKEVIAIPFGIDLAAFSKTPPQPGEVSLFSIGSMNWIPNAEGIRWFLDNVWPDIHRQFPGLTYHIAGREMPAWLKEYRVENVVIEGEVDDAYAFMLRHTIMIVPLFSGSGLRIKIIEGMAAGKSIISTTVGAEGIGYTNRENILIADQPCEFFEMISICMADRSLCKRIGENAVALIRQEYDRDVVIRKLTGFYKIIGAD
jgi:glycosyltransferase involved in cell wall biosynthesis